MHTSQHPIFSRHKTPDPIEIHLVQEDGNGDDTAYYYVAIHQSMAKKLFVSLKCRTTDIEQYGVILAFGFGKPDLETQSYIHTLLQNIQ